MTIAVIGAGASGMAAALQAAWKGASVTLFERNETVGRKLLVTGSGRCNITNDAAAADVYTCADTRWMRTLLHTFGVSDVLAMLTDMGIPVHKTSDGWYYPLSDSAHTVVDAFSSALNVAHVTLRGSTRVSTIHVSGNGFVVRSLFDGKEQQEEFDRVIVSAGGKAYPSLGSRGELFAELKRLGHTVLPLRPALAPLLIDLGILKPLQGVRLDVGATLWNGSTQLASTKGNLIFTQWGLNGPAVMNLSHQVSAHSQTKLELSLDLLAFFQSEFDHLLAQKRKSLMPLRIFLGAFFPPKVVFTLLKIAHVSGDTPLCEIPDHTMQHMVEQIQNTRLPVNGVRDFEFAQISAGGVPVTEVDPLTLESLRVNGLYLTGETLDVVGPCGGFNLQFAFSSGALAGRAAAR